MAHSPRLYNGRLHALNAGTGELDLVDTQAARFNPLAFLPGFARWLVGFSLLVTNEMFADPPLGDRLQAENQPAICLLAPAELASRRVSRWMRLGGVVRRQTGQDRDDGGTVRRHQSPPNQWGQVYSDAATESCPMARAFSAIRADLPRRPRK